MQVIAKSPAKARLYDAFAASGKALSNAARLELLDLLSQGNAPWKHWPRRPG